MISYVYEYGCICGYMVVCVYVALRVYSVRVWLYSVYDMMISD